MVKSDKLTLGLEALEGLEHFNQWILDEIRPHFGSRLAEVGGGIGTFAGFLVTDYLLRNISSSLEVFEPTAHLYTKMHHKLARHYPSLIESGRLVLTQGFFEPSEKKYDTVILINVLEHIEDDLALLRTAHETLYQGGTLIIFVPALTRLYSSFDKAVGHHRRYERPALEQLFLKAGFEVVKSQYMDLLGVLPWYFLNVLCGSQSLNPGLAHLYDKAFVPMTRWIEGIYPPIAGKNLLVVGQK